MKLELDKYYRLWQVGCGTIAMSDAELYLTIQNSGYSLSVPATFDADFQQTGLCKEDAYIDYIEKLYDKKYKISDNIVNRNTGLYPWKMESGFSDFLSTNSSPGTNVKWARYNKETYIAEKQKIVDEIEEMLNKDIPVVFSYNTFKEDDGIRLYISLENAKNDITTNDDRMPSSHYMTIIRRLRNSETIEYTGFFSLSKVNSPQNCSFRPLTSSCGNVDNFLRMLIF